MWFVSEQEQTSSDRDELNVSTKNIMKVLQLMKMNESVSTRRGGYDSTVFDVV